MGRGRAPVRPTPRGGWALDADRPPPGPRCRRGPVSEPARRTRGNLLRGGAGTRLPAAVRTVQLMPHALEGCSLAISLAARHAKVCCEGYQQCARQGNCTRSRSHSASQGSSTSCAATATTAGSASSARPLGSRTVVRCAMPSWHRDSATPVLECPASSHHRRSSIMKAVVADVAPPAGVEPATLWVEAMSGLALCLRTFAQQHQAGLTELVGTQPAQNVAVTRENRRDTMPGSCYYTTL